MDSKSPVLRFKEDDGNKFPDWEEKKLGDVASLISGHHLSPDEYDSGGEGVPYFTGPSDFTNDPTKFTKWTKLNSKVAPRDSVLITVKGSGVGKLMYSRLPEVAMGRQLMAVKSESSSNFLIYQYLHTKAQHFGALASGNLIPGLSRPDLLSTKIPTASLPEQRKIADFLTAVDKRIEQLIQKKALLEDYKKGVMQQLFTQAIRFKDDDGKDFPDWEDKKFGDILVIGSGRDYKHLNEGTTPVYGSGGVMTYVDDQLYEGESVCIGRKGTINKPLFLTGAFWTVDTLFYTHSFKEALPRFVYAIFQQINWLRYNEASGVPSLSKSTIERIPVSIPHPDEQTKIADFLSAIDGKIESVATQIKETQTLKLGLLQQMFV